MTLLKLFRRDEPTRAGEARADFTPFEQEIAAALGGMEAYARTHGGTLTLVSAERGREGQGDEVRIRLGGTCHGCPMSETTLRLGVEAHLRETFPAVRVVRSE